MLQHKKPNPKSQNVFSIFASSTANDTPGNGIIANNCADVISSQHDGKYFNVEERQINVARH